MYEEDVFSYVKEVINTDEQDTVERIFKGHLDFNNKLTRSKQKMAEAKGLRLIDTSIIQHSRSLNPQEDGLLVIFN